MFAVHLVGDDRLDVVAQQTGAPVVGVIGLVGEKVSRPRQMRGEHDGALDVGGLAGREIEGQGPARCGLIAAHYLSESQNNPRMPRNLHKKFQDIASAKG